MATTIQDDYLVCGEYKEQIANLSSEHPGFITFAHSNGNHYFAWVNNGEVVMRSEAYPDADKMERGIKAILKNCDLPERYSTFEEHGAHFLVLWGGGDHTKHTGNMAEHSEIGRSCPHKTREDLNAMMQFKGSDFANKVVPISATKNTGSATMAAASSLANATTNVANNTEKLGATIAHTAADTTASGGMGWLKWLLPLLLLLGAFLLWKSCSNKAESTTETTTNTTSETTTTSTIAADSTINTTTTTVDSANTSASSSTTTITESTKVKLADGSELNANKGGIESKLVTFLNDKNAQFDAADKKANWYDFDNLNFDLGKATITKESQVQIDNLAAILKAYPTLKIKVGGYTDKKGDDKANMTLSQNRADAVVAALKSKGANATQITGAEGYGETLAQIVETESDEARRVDRRTAVRIMAR